VASHSVCATEPESSQLAGNSVHVDRQFLLKYMPRITEYLSYRIVDVSSVRELCKRWLPKKLHQAPRKAGSHTAMADIKESLKELRFYKDNMFVKR
jgi:oligoribonuclease